MNEQIGFVVSVPLLLEHNVHCKWLLQTSLEDTNCCTITYDIDEWIEYLERFGKNTTLHICNS